jgi:hypothetical protein
MMFILNLSNTESYTISIYNLNIRHFKSTKFIIILLTTNKFIYKKKVILLINNNDYCKLIYK